MNSSLSAALNTPPALDLTHGIRPCPCPPDAQTTIGRLVVGHAANCKRAKARAYTWWLADTERTGTLSDYADDWEDVQYGRATELSPFVYTDTDAHQVTVAHDSSDGQDWRPYALTVGDQAALGALDLTALPDGATPTDRTDDLADLLHGMRIQLNALHGLLPGEPVVE
jgi:hypothetical protein